MVAINYQANKAGTQLTGKDLYLGAMDYLRGFAVAFRRPSLCSSATNLPEVA